MKRIVLLSLLLLIGFSDSYCQELKTNISVHDPVMIRQDSTYYLFCTGYGISMWSSKDMIYWKAEKPVFSSAPEWTAKVVSSFNNHIWAPDISYYNGQYYLFYSVSAFGKNTSAIGVATNKTLNPESGDYRWDDHGIVIQSIPGKTNWNAIDPNLITDKDGTPYLVFGSFWSGLKMVKLNNDRLSLAQPVKLVAVAIRMKEPSAEDNALAANGSPAESGGNAIEAPFIFRKGKYFYLFASIDYCCKGPQSTYKVIIGRSKKLIGPYLDKKGEQLTNGGGSVLVQGDKNWYGVGHNAVCEFNHTDYLIYHGYDASDNGRSKLIIQKLNWRRGWPQITSQLQSN